MKVELDSGMSVYLAKTYNNPANQMRDTVIIRKTGREMRVVSEIKAKQA